MRFAAFLRGINVGGRIVKMADLKACLEKAGYRHVATLLQSGNVVFEAQGTPKEHGAEIEKLLRARFGYDAQALVYRLADVEKIAAGNPFGDAGEEAHQYVIFADAPAVEELVSLSTGLDAKIERVRAGKRCVYWTVPKGSTLKSEFARRMAKARLLPRTTTRNLDTVRKLLALG